MMLRLRYLLMFALLQLACSREKEHTGMQPTSPPAPAPPPTVGALRYLALGDSYTIGQGVTPEESFPLQMRAWLKERNILLQDPLVIATTGWSTIALQNAIEREKPVGPFDVVTLLIGVNDQFQGLGIDGYTTRFRELLQRAISLASNRASRVFVLSIPDYSVTPFAAGYNRERIRQEINAFNVVNREITMSLGAQYLDITPSSREAEYDLTLLAADKLHPSGKEYKKWAIRLGEIMEEVLQ